MPRASNRDAVGAQHGRIGAQPGPRAAVDSHASPPTCRPGDAAAVQPRDFRRSCAAAGPNPDPDPTPVDTRRQGADDQSQPVRAEHALRHVRAISRGRGDHRPLGRRRPVGSRAHRDWLAAHQPPRTGRSPSAVARDAGTSPSSSRSPTTRPSRLAHRPLQSQRTDHVPLTPLRDADGNAGLSPGGPVRRAAADHRFHSASTEAAPRCGAYEGRSWFRSSDLPREPRREDGRDDGDQQLSGADTLVAADIPSPAADRPVVAERQKQARDRRRAALLGWTTSKRFAGSWSGSHFPLLKRA